jgi:hypothetical protein
MFVLLALAGAGCGGGGSETKLEKVEGEYKEAQAEVEAVNRRAEKASNEYLKASDVSGKLEEEQLDAITSGNMAKYHELQAATKAARANSQKLYRESEEQPYASGKLEARSETLANEIESLKGCDKGCQAERDRAVNLSIKCETSMMKAEIGFKQANEICGKRYPIPRENILHLQGEDE